MRYLIFLLILIAGCNSSQSTDDIVKNEIKLREARREHELKKITVLNQSWQGDTVLLVYYSADILANSKDSTITDSLFFIKSKGTIIPFLRNPQTDK